MGTINSGKFFDVTLTKNLFSGIQNSFSAYLTNSNTHKVKLEEVQNTNTWIGLDAIAGKMLFQNIDEMALDELLLLQKDMTSLQNTMLTIFATTVDADPEAKIDYDTLSAINNDFAELYEEYNSIVADVESKRNSLASAYGRYNSCFFVPDFSIGRDAYRVLCGSGEEDGFIQECMAKLVDFDSAASTLISDSGIYERIIKLSPVVSRMDGSSACTFDIQKIKLTDLNFFPGSSIIISKLEELLPDEYDSEKSLTENIENLWGKALGTSADTIGGVLAGWGIIPSKEEHLNRNQYNVLPDDISDIVRENENGELLVCNGWVELPADMSTYHTQTDGPYQGEEARYNHKFVHQNADGTGTEAIVYIPLDSSNGYDWSRAEYIIDSYNGGTFNYVNPAPDDASIIDKIETWPGHFIKDMIPYYLWGN